MDPTPDQVLDALTEQYKRAKDAYEHAADMRDKRMEQLRGTLERDVQILHDDLEGTIERLKLIGVDMELVTREAIVTPGAKIVAESLRDVYRLHGVRYRGKTHTVDITKHLLDNGAKLSPEEWTQRYPSSFYGAIGIPDTEIYMQIMKTLDQNEDHPDDRQREIIGEMNALLQNDFAKRHMMTSTMVTDSHVVHQHHTGKRLARAYDSRNANRSDVYLSSEEAQIWCDGDGEKVKRAMGQYMKMKYRVGPIICYREGTSLEMGSCYNTPKAYPARGVAIRDP